MAIDKKLQIFDDEGNPVDYDILASDVKFNDGKDLPTKLAEMEEEIGEGGYTPPAGGIPKTDLAPSVQQTLDDVANKVNKETGKGLSTNDYTDADKTKLAGLPTAGQLTQQMNSKANSTEVVKSISVNGGTPQTPTNGNVDIEVSGGGQQGPKGDKGDTVVVGGEQEFTIVNDTTTGGASDAFSAEMGKRVAGREAADRQRIDAIVAILKKSVFTDDQTAAFAALDALANGIDSISFDVTSHKFTGIGDTFTLNIVTDPAGKTAQVTWATSNASVATINNGLVTSVADGSAVITATTSDGKVAVCNVEVETVSILGVSLNKSTLTLNGNDANETLVATTNPAGYESGVQWSSSDPTKATVDNNGKVTAVANTEANTPVVITASIGGHSATCQVTVTGVVQTFHVNVGTLSNVTITDGHGNAITDGQAVAEGSALTINFTPASSHEISALSVVMGSTSLSLADATDGTDGVKVITIQSVSGDITVSASATYVRTNLFTANNKFTGRGVVYNTNGQYQVNDKYGAFIVPLGWGKQYTISGYNWNASGGVSGGFNFALIKDNGQGGYVNLLGGLTTDATHGDFISNTAFSAIKGALKISTYVYREGLKNTQQSSFTDETFGIGCPLESELNDIAQVYLVINYKFSSVDISANMTMYEKTE